MAITNHERVGKALDLLKAGLGLFVAREVKGALESRRLDAFKLRDYAEDPVLANKPTSEWDVTGLLKLMWETWNDVFRRILGPAERGLVGELRGHRNKWVHQESSSDDAYRALDSVGRLLAAISAPQSDELERLKMELLRVRFDEQARGERRRQAGTAGGSAAASSLKPWREIVTPHKDVASGRYQQAEFAADLWQVHIGEGTDEYRDPVEFFRRTYLTESLRGLRVGAATPSFNCRPTSVAARPTPCWPCITCSPGPRRGSWPESTPCCRRRRQRSSGRLAGWCWSATRSRRGTR